MNSTPKIKRRWWQVVVFTQEAYLALTGLAFFVLAVGKGDTNIPIAVYVFRGYLAAIIGLLISGVILIASGKKKPGIIALGFAIGAVAWFILLQPLFAIAMRRA